MVQNQTPGTNAYWFNLVWLLLWFSSGLKQFLTKPWQHHLPCGSYAINGVGDFVLPILPSSTQLYQRIHITIRSGIHISKYLIHAILHLIHYLPSGRASAMRLYGLHMKSPCSVLAFHPNGKLWVWPHNYVSPHVIHIILPLQKSWRSRTIISRMWYHLLFPIHCITVPRNVAHTQYARHEVYDRFVFTYIRDGSINEAVWVYPNLRKRRSATLWSFHKS